MASTAFAQMTNLTKLSATLQPVKVKSSLCDSPNPSPAEAEKCCAFPDLFTDTIVNDCEKNFSLNDSMVHNEFLADSVS